MPRRDPVRTAMTRRSALAMAATAVAATASAGTLAACAARPAPQHATIQLVLSMDLPGAGNTATTVLSLIENYLRDHFSVQNPGLKVKTVIGPSSTGTNGAPLAPTDAIQAVVAGTGPDVLSGTGYQLPAFLGSNLLVPLSSRVAQAGIDLTSFDAGHLHVLNQPPAGLYGLPAYDAPDVVLVNTSMLEGLGLPSPTADWTSDSAEGLWRQSAGLYGSTRLWGMVFDIQEYFLHLFGGHLMNADGTVCLLDQPPVLTAANWLVPLYQQQVVNVDVSGGDSYVLAGQAPCGMTSARNLPAIVTGMISHGYDWDLLPMPLFPGNLRYTYNNGDWYGINALSRQPFNALWALLSFVVLDQGFAEFMFRTTLIPPNRQGLWDPWLSIVRSVAPVLAQKQIEYYVEAMAYGVCNRRFRTQPYQCDDILQQWILRMFLGTVPPDLALTTATQQINALQGASASSSGSAG